MEFFKKNSSNSNHIRGDLFFFKKISLILLLFSFVSSLQAQDATFSQYYASGLYLNPAFSAAEPRLTFTSNYRNQWKSIASSPYTTMQASLIVPIRLGKIEEKHVGGFGISLHNSKAGEGNFQTIGANLNFGYNIRLSALNVISLGVQGGIVQKRISFTDLQWGSQFNPFIGGHDPGLAVDVNNLAQSASFPDFAAGIVYYFNPERDYEEKPFSIFAGGAVYHLTQPDESLVKDNSSPLPYLINSHAGFEVNVADRFNISPNVFVAAQNTQMQINTGCYFTLLFGDQDAKALPSFVMLGGWYRLNDSYIFSSGFGNSVYTIGFSYDLNNSSLRYSTGGNGAYEISLKIQKPGLKKIRTYNPLI